MVTVLIDSRDAHSIRWCRDHGLYQDAGARAHSDVIHCCLKERHHGGEHRKEDRGEASIGR